MRKRLAVMNIKELLNSYPYAQDFFVNLPVNIFQENCSIETLFKKIDDEELQEMGIGKQKLFDQFISYMSCMQQLATKKTTIESITIIGGYDKDGRPENIALNITAGEIICVVGPTGSGKSRLLADIEWVAQCDTPTKRQILINGQVPELKYRFSLEHKLVAQLSQNMNFVMDLTVEEFVTMHAESRMLTNIHSVVRNILAKANELAGETFEADTPVTALSGGQSRALMIADTAYLSSSPIVLIDEIENAGIDRQKALRLLVDKQKIVLLATHDPILALSGDKRLVIKNGGISQVIKTSAKERRNLLTLEKVDKQLASIREILRVGGRVDSLPAELEVS